MKILTKKNGIALVAVLTVLLVLTLLLPVMFTMADRATASAAKGQNEQRASYFARTALEMSVSAFQDVYDTYVEEKEDYEAAKLTGIPSLDDYPTYRDYTNITTFAEDAAEKKSEFCAETLYIFAKTEYKIPQEQDYPSTSAFQEAWEDYEHEAIVYKTSNEAPSSEYTLFATANCDIVYEEVAEYYEILTTGEMNLLADDYETDADGNYVLDAGGNKIVKKSAKSKYEAIKENIEDKLNAGNSIDNMVQCYKVDRKEVRFDAVATIDGKTYGDFSRGCLMILPTRPADEEWIVPASVEGHQIFPDTSMATGITEVTYNKNIFDPDSASEAMSQPVYMFSCVGNMVISGKGIEYTGSQSFADLSFGLHPETATLPANDPTFSCLKTNNMSSWAESAQKDNFVLFSATNGIQVELPVNLIVNPCRTGRIGDGFDPNQSLYKILVFQAPNILFKESVNSMISLWTDTGLSDSIRDLLEKVGLDVSSYDAPRMTSIMFAAPANTPYTYLNKDRDNKEVKAGKVIFMQDSYIWIIPFAENGTNYKTQTVYYKGSDIQMYKIANAGDVYYFNSEVPAIKSGSSSSDKTTGFSLSAWFMDVKYQSYYGNDEGLNFFEKFKNEAFGNSRGIFEKYLGQADYVNDDFHYVGNIYEDSGLRVPDFDDFYVVWDS